MCSQIACLYRGKVALVAFVWFFARVSSQMCPQIACLNRCKVANGCIHTFFFFNCLLKLSARTDAKWHWLHLSAFSPEWVFKCVLKLPACTDAKSHWLHLNAFSNVSSNCLPEQMQSGNGCICPLFLQSEFSNVSSNCLPVQMHSSIDCIWTIFHLREFSDVSSNYLPK